MGMSIRLGLYCNRCHVPCYDDSDEKQAFLQSAGVQAALSRHLSCDDWMCADHLAEVQDGLDVDAWGAA